jgi:hypothetical protein
LPGHFKVAWHRPGALITLCPMAFRHATEDQGCSAERLLEHRALTVHLSVLPKNVKHLSRNYNKIRDQLDSGRGHQ